MVCAQKNCVYALIGLIVCLQSFAAFGKDHNGTTAENAVNMEVVYKDKFQWNEHKKLSWDDFKGDINAAHDESAAATCCGIGFKTNNTTSGSKPEIIVYNTFYTKKSWVRADAKLQSILDHEQGHFDLCEIYTRKLKDRIAKFDSNIPDMMKELMRIYTEVNNEYEARQQAYEKETTHGTNMPEQKRWTDMIGSELM